ncbi:MAG: gliding motility-associated C-terminal domain-containing protein [Bacteroidaceae bacterium]|nr:gliding motility-associated C-terminal domain-containing protein [Bacteroidaceae bacterium]
MRHLDIRVMIIAVLCAATITVHGQTCSPTASYILANGDEASDLSEGQSAPVVAHFEANPQNVGSYSARYEWRIYEPGHEDSPIIHRFDETLDYTFSRSGSFLVQCYATFVLDNDTIIYPEEGEANPFTVTILESILEIPNGFSPNDDQINDEYMVKTHQSIVSFKATIFNRWGQRLYSTSDINFKWDGKVGGRVIKDGVYFINVEARGADGHEYHIRKDINVLTGYTNEGDSTSNP